ncbi:HAD family hydrolase [Streptomyces albidoflavus]|uniref:Hydrolase n=1 Tax=Streptomyces albidoflavus TaxID=1886 RepID=A0AA37BU15_9ACTN|nr:HAD-IA family hydrolase [Streptomyces albidoflavus]RZE64252.1 hydrolase [Streptomyces albidoflavus]WQG69917.1 HAD-IA family hydrolase [Streptomyces albidoflavus]GHI44169.1 hydrolase [Streptomyces albidoflavus]
MAITGVLFDFSGTLMRIESPEEWLRGGLAELGAGPELLPDGDLGAAAARLARVGAQPGGPSPARVPDHLSALWDHRDRSARAHRAVFTGLSRQVELGCDALHDVLYERHMTPAAWRPYPDTAEVLRTLRERGVRVAVVSNIGWDLRPVLRAHGLERWADTSVLSYEHGVQKPDARLFALACERIGVAPGAALMVGDDRRADGGAAALGCAVHFVDHLPVDQRPCGLLPVLELVAGVAQDS